MDLKTGEIVQLTATDRDTRLVQPGANRNAPAIVESAGDLTPGAPGNAGGVSHLYLVSFAAKPKPTVQLTSGPEPVAFEIVAGQFALFRSYGDLVAGGNADGSLEVFAVNLRGAPTIRQISNGIDGATFIWGNPPPDGKSVFLASTADLAPGAPGNADGSLELFRAKLR
jgi:hypothetical protein